ncbi:ribonuclease H2, subunit C [Crepidotus variabilis]|uniref:Ribonuclease H2, subunit C n=1 Tax=Crepidotus variabilis TaxID=179855 RepID=A0A9P6E4P6_9AGAR|nr:ribonuclease H2, subunit C [Crepidotus variabilis]
MKLWRFVYGHDGGPWNSGPNVTFGYVTWRVVTRFSFAHHAQDQMATDNVRLTIPVSDTEGSLVACKPNLMPFHIQYTGPASVRTFMLVEKLKFKGNDGSNSKLKETSNPKTTDSGVVEMKRETSKMDVDVDTPPVSVDVSEAISPEEDVDMAPVTLTRTNTEPIIVDSQPEITPSTSILTSMPSSSTLAVSAATSQTSISVGPSASSSSLVQAPLLEDLDKRVVSSFRGRTIHGLEVEVPAGYIGVVFKAEGGDSTQGAGTTEAAEEKVEKKRGRTRQDTTSSRAKASASTSSAKKDSAQDEDEEPTRLTRRRGRFTSSAVPMKGTVITIEDDDKPEETTDTPMVDLTNEDEAPAAEDSPTTKDDLPTRKITPQAQFASFTLWQADRVVDKTNDEYMKALTEWVGLASEIHRTDLDFE